MGTAAEVGTKQGEVRNKIMFIALSFPNQNSQKQAVNFTICPFQTQPQKEILSCQLFSSSCSQVRYFL